MSVTIKTDKFENGIKYVTDVKTYTKSDLVIGQEYSFLFGTIGKIHPVVYSENTDSKIVDEIIIRLNETVETTEFGSDWMTVTIKNKYQF